MTEGILTPDNSLSGVKVILPKYYAKNSSKVKAVTQRPLEKQLTAEFDRADELITATTRHGCVMNARQ